MSGNPQNGTGYLATSSNVANVYTGLNRDELDRIVESLQDECQIGISRDRARSYRRFAHLNAQELFNRLTTLYESLFASSWSAFKHATLKENKESQSEKITAITKNYITAWFWDLHVTIRSSTQRISGTAFNQYFSHPITHILDRYDPFLQHLNSTIRPTHIMLGLEDTLYIPIISDVQDWNDDKYNLHSLDGAECDLDVVYSIIEIMESKRNDWTTVPLSNSALGRPGWLFDYRYDQAYAWFPMDSNYTREDLIAPHILGIPCTPRLGIRDFDEEQICEGNDISVLLEPDLLERATPRKTFGAAEYRTIEHYVRTIQFDSLLPRTAPTAARPPKRTRVVNQLLITERGETAEAASQADEITEDQPPEIPQPFDLHTYRIIDWCYFGRVTIGTDERARMNALRNFIFTGAYEPPTSTRN